MKTRTIASILHVRFYLISNWIQKNILWKYFVCPFFFIAKDTFFLFCQVLVCAMFLYRTKKIYKTTINPNSIEIHFRFSLFLFQLKVQMNCICCIVLPFFIILTFYFDLKHSWNDRFLFPKHLQLFVSSKGTEHNNEPCHILS